MAQYRISRNLEASLIDYIESIIEDGGWTNVSVQKGFYNYDKSELPIICVRVNETDHQFIEIGDKSTIRNITIYIDIFATSDGNRLDMKDYLVEKLKLGCPYYLYTIENGTITEREQDGKIDVTNITDSPTNFNIDKNLLSEEDRFRHLLTLTISLNKIEE